VADEGGRAMKYGIITLGCVLTLLSLRGPVIADKMFWDTDAPRSAVITNKDFNVHFDSGVNQDKLIEQDIYDGAEDIDSDEEPSVEPRSRVGTTNRSRSLRSIRLNNNRPESNRSRSVSEKKIPTKRPVSLNEKPGKTTEKSTTAVNAATKEKTSKDTTPLNTPKTPPTQITTAPTPKNEKEGETPGAADSASQGDPGLSKLRWGKVKIESPSQEEGKKLRWGQ
jgi:hypothetical protein